MKLFESSTLLTVVPLVKVKKWIEEAI